MIDILGLLPCNVQNIESGLLKNNTKDSNILFDEILMNLINTGPIQLDFSPPKMQEVDILDDFNGINFVDKENFTDNIFVNNNLQLVSENRILPQDLIEDVENVRDKLINESSPSDGEVKSDVLFNITKSNSNNNSFEDLVKDSFIVKEENKFTKNFSDSEENSNLSNKTIPTQLKLNNESKGKNDDFQNNDNNLLFVEHQFTKETLNLKEVQKPFVYVQKNIQESIVKQVLDKVEVTTCENNTKIIDIQLHPKSLGNVNITIKQDITGISIKFIVQNEMVKDTLNENSGKLLEHFEQQNIKVNELEIIVETHQNDKQRQDENNKEKKRQRKVYTITKKRTSKDIFDSMQFKNTLQNFKT